MISVDKKLGRSKPSFTPTYYKKAYEQYKSGVVRHLIALMKEAEVDSHVQGCLIGRRAGFQRDWSISPYDSDNSTDQERAEIISDMFSEMDVRTLFKKIHEGVSFIYSVIDFEWEVVNNLLWITDFKFYEQHYFKLIDDEVRIDNGSKTGLEIPQSVMVARSRDLPIMLSVLREFILKNFGLESWASFLETFGEAIIIGKYPAGAGEEMIAAVDAAVNAIASSSRGSMPNDGSIEIVETNRTGGDHKTFKEAMDKGISISLLGHANAVEDSSGMRIGENLAPFKVRREIALDDIAFIESKMNWLVRLYYEQNYSDGRYPKFVIDKSEPIVVTERIQVIDCAYDKGFIIHPDEFRKLGLKVDPNQQTMQRGPNPFDFTAE